MATQRKRWFRVADSLGQEPIPNDELATLLRLMAELNTRWARDGLGPEEACTILLRPGDLASLTGCSSLARARRIAHSLETYVSLKVEELGANTRLTWPKWSEFQQLTSPKLPEEFPEAAPKLPPPQDAPARRKTQDAEDKTAADAAATSAAPDPVAEAWALGLEAAGQYQGGKAPEWELTEARAGPIRKLLRERKKHGQRAFAAVVHGYRYARRDWAKADEHFTPDTLLRAKNRGQYVEAYEVAIARGLSPPFARASPPQLALVERTEEQRAADFAAAERDRQRLLREGKIGQGLRS